MTEKIIFWFGVEFTHFCLSYELQKKIDADFFAIIDITKKPKKFFENQNLVNFKKSWYFFDHVKKQNITPDYDYLQNFEKKYNINLWKIAINERIFYRFFDDFYKFTSNEICSILEQECKLFEKIIDEVKPDYIITKDPSRHHHHLFTELCRSKKIKVLNLSRTILGNKVILSQNSHQFDNISDLEAIDSSGKSFEDLRQILDSSKFSNFLSDYNKPSKINKKINAVKEYLLADSDENQSQYYYYGRTKSKVLKNAVVTTLQTKNREKFLEKNSSKNLNSNLPFAYFPLHVDMERPLLIGAPYFTNQIEIIRHIVKSLPVGYTLFVKESPVGNSRAWRPISEYEEILKIPNVRLIHHSVPAKKLFEKCSLVFTVAGTSGFEATFYGKTTIVFSDVGYLSLPSVQRVKNIEELPQLISNSLKTKVDSNDLDKFVNFLQKNSIDFDWFGFQKKFNELFYHDGHLFDVEISESKIKSFIEENESILNNLADEHISKMNFFKK